MPARTSLSTSKPPMSSCCAIIELRQYTTYPGKRDALIDLFEREFIESQEATGIRVVGQFRDLGDPNRYVWLRGFPDMPARARALGDFYSGPVWKAHRDAANATMYDSDNVLLLRPARSGAGFDLGGIERAARGQLARGEDLVAVTIYHFAQPVSAAFIDWFDSALRPAFERAGSSVLAELVSDHSENTFPKLPVREGENAFVWIARYPDRRAYDDYLGKLAADARWSGDGFAALYQQLARPPETVLLQPTPRSLIGHTFAR
jgi:hypothetical protein